ncbi:hypothetical protein CBL_10353 [Carabus blaptoides fortunei]
MHHIPESPSIKQKLMRSLRCPLCHFPSKLKRKYYHHCHWWYINRRQIQCFFQPSGNQSTAVFTLNPSMELIQMLSYCRTVTTRIPAFTTNKHYQQDSWASAVQIRNIHHVKLNHESDFKLHHSFVSYNGSNTGVHQNQYEKLYVQVMLVGCDRARVMGVMIHHVNVTNSGHTTVPCPRVPEADLV